MKLKYLSLIFLMLMLPVVYSSTIIFNPQDSGLSVSSYYCNPNVANCLTINEGSPLFEKQSISYASTYDYNPSSSSAIYKDFYFYKSGKRIESYVHSAYSSGSDSLTIYALQGYFVAGSDGTNQPYYSDLRSSTCKPISITYTGTTPEINQNSQFPIKIISNLNTYTSYGGKYVTLPQDLVEYYYMNTTIKVKVISPSGNESIIYNQNQLLPEYTTPLTITPTFTPTEYGTYTIQVSTDTTSEGKCTNSRGVNTGYQTIGTFTIAQPTCQVNQYFADNNNVQISSKINQKVFPFLKLTKQDKEGKFSEIFVLPNNLQLNFSNGDTFLETITGLTTNYNNLFVGQVDDGDELNTWGLGAIIFYDGKEYSSYRDNFTSELHYSNQMPYIQLNGNVNLEYNLDTLRSYLENQGEDSGNYKIESYVISLDNTQCSDNDIFLNENLGFFSIELKNPNEKDIEYNKKFIEVSCDDREVIFDQNSQKIIYTGSHGSSDNGCGKLYASGTKLFDTKKEDELINWGINNPTIYNLLNSNDEITLNIETAGWGGSWPFEDCGSYSNRGQCTLKLVERYEYNDNNNLNKIVCNKNKTECKFSDTDEIINLPNTNKNNIKIYKENILVRTESVNPVTIALKASAIKKFKTVSQAQEFIDSSVILMQQFNISKYLNYNSVTNKTTVQIKLQGTPKNNLTLYQIIPKDFANRLNEIEDISNNGQFIVLDKDPVIGWYFNDSENNENVNYTLPGDNEGGTIIITQEPILFNEGELIINYRESSCNLDELELFTLSDLENSVINPTNPVYHVCLAHINDTISNTLQLNNNNNNIHIFNYANYGNMSLTSAPISLDVSTTDNTIYWNVQYQETNPDGTFSCLGSYNNKDSSTFGDCGYTTNRIWLHLGEDITPPTTTLSYPYLAHKMKIQLNAEDFGSGVDKTFYCITGQDDDCTPNIETSNNKDIYVECSNKWGCVKKIKYYSTDIEGNVEPTKEYLLTLIEQGSACQSDCTAKPTPNRIIKDCINLNGCTFFGDTLDEQKEVADKCHYTTAGTWIQYNETTEIMCPNGPTRPAQFTQNVLKFWDSLCDNIQTVSYPVLIDGQQVNMVFVYCEEY